jgi:hypothetical protein
MNRKVVKQYYIDVDTIAYILAVCQRKRLQKLEKCNKKIFFLFWENFLTLKRRILTLCLMYFVFVPALQVQHWNFGNLSPLTQKIKTLAIKY